ncbi:MAG: hypothetical protein DRQ58_08670 [Gammaproteobacteria bacterium]|nr:MAG: hypothetical protein DRQ58_08670 [Gammaproteobacteria bacterium]
MKLSNKYLVFIQLTALFFISGGSAWAAEAPMICAVTETVACQKGGDCQSGSAADSNMPVLLKINPGKNEIISRKEDGEKKTSTIKQTTNDKAGRFVIYQGVEQGGAWSTVIDKTTGSMTISIAAGENDAVIIFGSCSASLLK